MESRTDQESVFNSVVDTLVNMFGDVLCRDAIFAVVESCEGDLSLAAEAIMNITSDTSNDGSSQANAIATVIESSSPVVVKTPPIVQTNLIKFCPPNEIKYCSYASTSRNTGAIPKQAPYSTKPPPPAIEWSEQVKRIFTYHNQGYRVHIIMRGVPGSGKSHFARQIIDATIGSKFTDYNTHIFSTDDYFMVSGNYQYDKYRLRDAHEWNQSRVKTLLQKGLSPLILDNTNIEVWEMEPYVRRAVENGYYIELIEPTTHWAKKATVLFRKNIHNVPLVSIRRMLDNFQNITVNELFQRYNITYPPSKIPPVARLIPPIPEAPKTKEDSSKVKTTVQIEYDPTLKTDINKSDNKVNKEVHFKLKSVEQKSLLQNKLLSEENVNKEKIVDDEETIEKQKQQQKHKEFQIKVEEFEKIEMQWENGDSWDEGSNTLGIVTENSQSNAQSVEPKPPRKNKSQEESSSALSLDKVQNCSDWSKISLLMPCWNDSTQEPGEIPEVKVVTTSSSTCIERFDTDLDNPKKVVKIISATPRDINIDYIPPTNEKIPIIRMLDKSTLTNEQSIMDAFRCENEEQHFKALRRLFKNIPKDYLRDIFDKCQGDVNWAVSIVLEDEVSTTLKSQDEDLSEDEGEETEKQCSCLAAYNIIPNTSKKITSIRSYKEEASMAVASLEPEASENPPTPVKKIKISPSESSVQLKQDIEKSIVISDEHYSEHCLKIKKMRQGIATTSNSPPLDDTANAMAIAEDEQVPKVNPSDDEESVSSEEAEKTISINLGRDFLGELDNLFGRKGMTYPDDIVPRINIPISLLNEINAFWMESLMHQMDIRDKQYAKMLEEDAEFARQLQLKEEELVKAGKEPEVPDFKEIMDMDLALSVYQKEVAEWRSKEPTNMAAKMTRDKLYNLFPDMSPDILSELLMAHDNNFKDTVEVLLASTGQASILEEKNGLNKFVMKREMERQEKILAEEKKALSEVEWPLLPKGEKVDMVTVYEYRDEADRHLAKRNESIQKAQEYIRRGMTQVANYYSDFASIHKKKYEHANSLAALTLIQIHAANSPDNATIDLHYLRVSEAKETLDLFLDTHINKLRESPVNGVRFHTLFFITGRGLHSNGRPRIKPAVKNRLNERAIAFKEGNPGLLTANVCAEHKLSHQVHKS